MIAQDPRIPTPALATRVQAARAIVGQTLTDTVAVTGDDGEDATIAATLFGPVPPPPSGACSDLSLAQYTAGPSRSFTASVRGSSNKGNGDVLVSGPVVTDPGCYGWAESLTLVPSGAKASSPPTAPNESTLVTVPAVATTASAQFAAPGSALTDTVVVTGLSGQAAALVATLYGPLPADHVTGCAADTDAVWRSAIATHGGHLSVGTQTLPITGDGTYKTDPMTVSTLGCYTFFEQLTPASTPTRPVRTPYGVPGESTVVSVPAVGTAASANVVTAGAAITDLVTVTGAAGLPGTVSGALLGPVAPVHGSCAGLTWSGAHVAAVLAPVAIKGDGMYRTAPITVHDVGCYTFVERLTLADTTAPVVSTVPGVPIETILVSRPVVTTSGPATPLARTGAPLPITATVAAGVGLIGSGLLLMCVPRRRRADR